VPGNLPTGRETPYLDMSPPGASSMSHPTYLEQTVSLLSTVAGYMRLPALATSVCICAHCPSGQQPLLLPHHPHLRLIQSRP